MSAFDDWLTTDDSYEAESLAQELGFESAEEHREHMRIVREERELERALESQTWFERYDVRGAR